MREVKKLRDWDGEIAKGFGETHSHRVGGGEEEVTDSFCFFVRYYYYYSFLLLFPFCARTWEHHQIKWFWILLLMDRKLARLFSCCPRAWIKCSQWIGFIYGLFQSKFVEICLWASWGQSPFYHQSITLKNLNPRPGGWSKKSSAKR